MIHSSHYTSSDCALRNVAGARNCLPHWAHCHRYKTLLPSLNISEDTRNVVAPCSGQCGYLMVVLYVFVSLISTLFLCRAVGGINPHPFATNTPAIIIANTSVNGCTKSILSQRDRRCAQPAKNARTTTILKKSPMISNKSFCIYSPSLSSSIVNLSYLIVIGCRLHKRTAY